MSEPIYVWRYVLKSRAKLNAVSKRREFAGALIRVGDGFGCLHPWPELGDPGLASLLRELKHDAVGDPLTKEAVKMAAIDEQGRRRGESMLEKIADKIPESHATLPDCTSGAVGEAVRRGFSVIKIKGRRDYPELAGRMDEISRKWPDLRWRVDFNEVLSLQETLCFAQCMSDHVRTRLDFIEDPCPYERNAWDEIRRVTGLALAIDRNLAGNRGSFDLVVLKPAREGITCHDDTRMRTVVTSNMDHPLGQCFAALRAGRLVELGKKVEVCGLQTQDLFEPTEFSERLGPARPKFQSPGGTGLGFDDLLERLPWKRLR